MKSFYEPKADITGEELLQMIERIPARGLDRWIRDNPNLTAGLAVVSAFLLFGIYLRA